jgi:hypothetical protein
MTTTQHEQSIYPVWAFDSELTIFGFDVLAYAYNRGALLKHSFIEHGSNPSAGYKWEVHVRVWKWELFLTKLTAERIEQIKEDRYLDGLEGEEYVNELLRQLS